MRAVIGGIISILIPICVIGGALLWLGYWIIKKAVRNGIIETVKELEERKQEEEEQE